MTPETASVVRPQRARWAIIGVIFLATVSNYVDRQTLNVLSPLLLKEFELDKIQFSQIIHSRNEPFRKRMFRVFGKEKHQLPTMRTSSTGCNESGNERPTRRSCSSFLS